MMLRLFLEVTVCFTLALYWFPGDLDLVISPLEGDKPILVLPLVPDERFTLHYIHSVDKSPVWEEHSVDEFGNIYIEEEVFVKFGAGMGHWTGHGTLTKKGPYQAIVNIHERIGDFVLRVGGEGIDHAILWRGKRFDLSNLAAGQAVSVSAHKVSLLERLWRRVIPYATFHTREQ